jgi:lysophospholipase L1-like esterase
LNELQRTGASIIFATTTPVPYDETNRSNAEIDQYNAAAVELMNRYGVEVNDLNRIVKQDLSGCLCPDRLHMSELGNARLAERVTAAIRPYL